MKVYIHPAVFNQLLFHASRYWNGYEGMRLIRAEVEKQPAPEIILVREDGWSICTTEAHFESAVALYKWVGIFQKQTFGNTGIEKVDYAARVLFQSIST